MLYKLLGLENTNALLVVLSWATTYLINLQGLVDLQVQVCVVDEKEQLATWSSS